jgi:hypothetical protein
VLSFYANGGLNENHVAQIAPAGAYRVWAEQETGGEAYIPLAASKRDRSLAIWAETGKRLGVDNYADGSPIYASSGTSAPMSVQPTSVSLEGATLMVRDADGSLIGRMRVEADARIKRAASDYDRRVRNGWHKR